MKYTIFALLGVFLLSACSQVSTDESTTVVDDMEKMEEVKEMDMEKGDNDEMDKDMEDEMEDMDKEVEDMVKEKVYTHFGDLADVTNGEEVGGIVTKKARGTAKARFSPETGYELEASAFLPKIQDDSFYEGWVVRKGLRFSVISTGPLENIDGKYVNTYTAEENLLDHTAYIITIEPNDGDPAPAGHVLEGALLLQK